MELPLGVVVVTEIVLCSLVSTGHETSTGLLHRTMEGEVTYVRREVQEIRSGAITNLRRSGPVDVGK